MLNTRPQQEQSAKALQETQIEKPRQLSREEMYEQAMNELPENI